MEEQNLDEKEPEETTLVLSLKVFLWFYILSLHPHANPNSSFFLSPLCLFMLIIVLLNPKMQA